jgi:hypothetical protein
MLLSNNEKIIIEDWLASIKADLIANYKRLGLKASGAFEQSLESYLVETQAGIRFGIKGAYHSYFMEKGRKPTAKFNPGNPTLREVIRKWIDDKGITPDDGITKDSLAFLIARKIHEKGITVPNKYNLGGVISDIINEKSIKELSDQLIIFYVKQFKSNILQWQ